MVCKVRHWCSDSDLRAHSTEINRNQPQSTVIDYKLSGLRACSRRNTRPVFRICADASSSLTLVVSDS
eukprot:1315346-Rhodomonas_salina.1